MMQTMRVGALGALVMVVASCATAPKKGSDRAALEQQAQAALQSMRSREPMIDSVLDDAAGYAVFPSIGKAGVVAGAAYGRGILYQGGMAVGFVELNQGSLGATLGAQTFSELIVMQTPDAVARMKSGQFSVGADISAVALTAGAAANVNFNDGIAVFVLPKGGLMADVSVSGQQINFQPRGSPEG